MLACAHAKALDGCLGPAVPRRAELARDPAVRAADQPAAPRPGARQALPDLRDGRRRATRASHAWASAPGYCPPQYTRVFEGESGPIYSCDYAGADLGQRQRRAVRRRTWWNMAATRVTEFSPAAKAQLGTWDTRFDDDYAALARRAAAAGAVAESATEAPRHGCRRSSSRWRWPAHRRCTPTRRGPWSASRAPSTRGRSAWSAARSRASRGTAPRHWPRPRRCERAGWNFSVGLGPDQRRQLRAAGPDRWSPPSSPAPTWPRCRPVLGECFDRAQRHRHRRRVDQVALRQALSCYYSGNFATGFRHGYVRKVVVRRTAPRSAHRPTEGDAYEPPRIDPARLAGTAPPCCRPLLSQAALAQGFDKINTTVTNVNTILVTISIAVVTIAIIWAGFKMIFQGARLADVANVLIGGTLVGGAAAFASYIVT
ncbi:MAG: TrbC/VirB2 family protein [Comamonadaceae bacterium]|nr:TrbC/VirB2 family protein [Comamonadaceae bacterium]